MVLGKDPRDATGKEVKAGVAEGSLLKYWGLQSHERESEGILGEMSAAHT